jgi:aspartyl-tRNA(Asn)/glutamyl-tRNA(Gln) amidotransferase subunit A
MSGDEATLRSISEVGALIANGSLSAGYLVEATLRRIEHTEPRIHAYALIMADQAREDARRLDQEMAQGRNRGPLHGIPIGVKDLCYTAGIPTEAGSKAMAGFVPTFNATVVDRLREAGAIVIGKTVTHEFAYGVNTPPTRNAWGLDCYPGGSSAGSGAAVAARSAFGAIGTDTGGSIREPAALNGLVGLKPTFGLVSRYGVVPLSPSLDHAGPITRTVEDCAILLQTLAGYDARDSGSIAAPIEDYRANLEGEIKGLTIGVQRLFPTDLIQPEVRAALDTVIAELADLGAKIVKVEMPAAELINTVGVTLLLADASAYNGRTLRDRGADLDPATRVMFELGEFVPAAHYVAARRARALVRNRVRELFHVHHLDAVISPTTPNTTAPMNQVSAHHNSGEDIETAGLNLTLPANLTGQPALTVPCGFSAAGLPIGFQLIGRPFGESVLFRLARAYEKQHGWTHMAPKDGA